VKRRWLCKLLLIPLWLQAMVPFGFMPAISAAGVPMLELCSSIALPPALSTAAQHHEHMHHAGHGAHTAGASGSNSGDDQGATTFARHKFCGFAAASSVAIAPAPTLAIDVVPAVLPAPLPSVPALRLTQFSASHYARGPPALT
jgi:hypothetical protein